MIKNKIVALGAFIFTLSTTVQANDFVYKPASPTQIAAEHQKVQGSHRERFIKPYEIQRLSDSVYWVSVSNYNVTVIVGKESVLLIDAPHGTGKKLLKAIKSITDKPLTAIVYSHAHADHVGDSGIILKELGLKRLDIYGTQEVQDALISHKVTLPLPVNKIITNGLMFEGHYLKAYSSFNGHTQDNTALIINDHGRKIIHAIDLIHPDQLEFRSFSNVEDGVLGIFPSKVT
ncbi:MAG: MBL fold metallo-hydrolase [Psychrobium sp.]